MVGFRVDIRFGVGSQRQRCAESGRRSTPSSRYVFPASISIENDPHRVLNRARRRPRYRALTVALGWRRFGGQVLR